MLITISGPPGGGKTTVATAIAEAFDLDHVSGGDIFRSLAEERGYSLVEFNALAEEDDSIDRDLDHRLRETARDSEELVLESRLSGWMAGDYADLRVWLDAPLDVRAARIARREGNDQETARRETKAREDSEKRRYREYYGIEFEDQSIYDLAVNTGRWGEDAVVDVVSTAINAYGPGHDEGAVTFETDYEF
jgi:cytidylate kinase